MKIEGEYVFHGLRKDVWELVRDPEALSTALPGAQQLTKVTDEEYVGEMHMRVGPVSGVFSGRLLVSNEVPPESCTLTVDGKGGPGFARGSGNCQLIDLGDGTTLMKYQGDIQIGGRLTSVGQRMLDTVSRSIIRQGLDTLDKALQARAAARAAGQRVEFEAPTQTEFAAAVARDTAGQMLSSLTTWIGVAAILIIIVVLLVIVLR
jgi:carbon monoxide dehydrogenase subunit G